MIKFFLPLLLLLSCGKPIKEEHQKYSSINQLKLGVIEKNILGMKMFLNFNLLPLTGEVKDQNRYWSDNSWRLNKGSINFRWNSPGQEGRFAPSPSAGSLKQLSQEELKRLAPSEKYDLLMGRYDYPLKYQIDQTLPHVAEDWEGLCHGWAGASLNHSEPKPKTLTNPHGIKIPFGASDIKALLSYYYSGLMVPDDYQLGSRCEQRGIFEEDFCDNDVTALDFHTVLTNKLGLRGQGIIVDTDRYREVWNHPVISYETKILNSKKIPLGRILTLDTSIYFVEVVENNSWFSTNNTRAQMISKMRFQYELHLDTAGNMIDSHWLSRNRPDFIWTINKVEKFTGYLSALGRLVE